MKGKVSFYFNAPNTVKVRSRIENPSEGFTQNLRAAICESIIEVVNESTLAIRAKLIKKFAEMGEPVKADQVDALSNVLANYFDVVAQDSPFVDPDKPEKPAKESPAKEEGFDD